MKKLIALIASLLLTFSATAGDITVTHDNTFGALTPVQIQKVEAARSLWDYIVLDNGTTGTHSVIKIKVQPSNLGSQGPLAQVQTTQYLYNSRGKLVLDGERTVTMKLNINAGLANWNIDYFTYIVFHEMGHTLGMDIATFVTNGYVTGNMLNPNNQYVGPALAVYQFERDPLAQYIPTDFGHLAEALQTDWWYNEIMTTGISYSQYPLCFISKTTVKMIEDNGWTVNPNFQGGLLSELIPTRRLRDEDPIIIP